MELKRFCNETESNRVVYPYKEQWYATWNNGRNNADGRNGECNYIYKDL